MSKSAACVVCGVVTPVQIYTDKYYCTDHFPPPEESTLREDLKDIVTRRGMTARIPEMLELELDQLEKLIQERERLARIDELVEMCRKYWQLPIPEQAMLDRIKELKGKQAVKVKAVTK